MNPHLTEITKEIGNLEEQITRLLCLMAYNEFDMNVPIEIYQNIQQSYEVVFGKLAEYESRGWFYKKLKAIRERQLKYLREYYRRCVKNEKLNQKLRREWEEYLTNEIAKKFG